MGYQIDRIGRHIIHACAVYYLILAFTDYAGDPLGSGYIGMMVKVGFLVGIAARFLRKVATLGVTWVVGAEYIWVTECFAFAVATYSRNHPSGPTEQSVLFALPEILLWFLANSLFVGFGWTLLDTVLDMVQQWTRYEE